MTATAVTFPGDKGGDDQPHVRIVTERGDIVVRLYPDRAPATVAAFMAAVDAGAYRASVFGRTVRADNDRGTPPIEVIQGYCVAPTQNPTLPHEPTSQTGLPHKDGTISLPRQDGGSGSPYSFFICLGDQPALDAGGGRTKDGLGFAAFGEVVQGLDVARAIHAMAAHGETDHPFLDGQILDPAVAIHHIGRVTTDPAAALARLAEDVWAYRVREFPTEASSAGEVEAGSRLDGASEQDHARRATECGAMLARADAIAESALKPDEGITLALLRGQLQAEVDGYRLGGRYAPVLFPMAFFDLPDYLIQQTALDTARQRDDFAARLAAIPRFIADNLALLETGFARGFRLPTPLLPRILSMLDAHLSADGLAAKMTGRLSQFGLAGSAEGDRLLDILAQEVLPALRLVRDRFDALGTQELTDAVGLCAQAGGRDWYLHCVQVQTSLTIDPDRIHAVGVEEVARINAEIEAVLAEMGRPGERAAVAAELDARLAKDGDELLERTRALAKRIDGLIPRLIGRTPRSTYGVEPMTPAASTGLPPALALPGPADRSMPGVYLLTALPEKCPLHLLVPLTLHEAWPGHLMQLALAQELEALPAFRRHGWTSYNGYVEGWALYCERLGRDIGLYEDPRDRFGLLSFEMWRAARLVVDTGIHWLGWTRDAAIDYMADHCFLPRATIESEVDRYIGMPAQALSYKMGERVIAALRQKAEAACGTDFSLRAFHDAILAMGPVSLDLLETGMTRWIEEQAA